MGDRIRGSTVSPPTVGTSITEDVSEVGGKKPALKPDETIKKTGPESSKQTKGAQQHALSQQVEGKIQTGAKGLAPLASTAQQISHMMDSAKESGVGAEEVNKLKNRLLGLDDKSFATESSFLRNHVLHTANTDRAIRTYNALKAMQDGHGSKRLTNEHIHVLSRGVSESRTSNQRGLEGVLGQDAAINAGNALIGMTNGDYKKLNTLLNHAGVGHDGNPVHGSSAQMEKALILKAVGVRQEELCHPSIKERLKTWAGKPTNAMAVIQKYGQDIRGMERSNLAQNSTSTDLYAGMTAIAQRWTHSCGPTTIQGIKADADPVYALKLHKEFIHSMNVRGEIGKEQKEMLETYGGKAVQRGKGLKGGEGIAMPDLLNDQVAMYTGHVYTDTPCVDSVQGRNNALDDAVDRLKRGIDVPIGVQFKSAGHCMLLSDVRGSGDSQRFLVTDPFKGSTNWYTRKDLASGATKLPIGTCKLSFVY